MTWEQDRERHREQSARAHEEYLRAPKVRVGDLKPGDLTQHAGGSCDDSCPNPFAPWRVEKLEAFGTDGINVTWSHPPCRVVAQPLPCADYCEVAFFGAGS